MTNEEKHTKQNGLAVSEQSDDGYVCGLDEQSLQVAREDLNEDPLQRLQAVDTFRKWISEQPHMSSPTDIQFLLQFLRIAKFSQLVAREKLEQFLTAKTAVPEWLADINTSDLRLLAFVNTGYIIPLPGRTEHGCKVIMQRLGALDPATQDYNKNDIMKANNAIIYHALMDENTQVNGMVFIVDCSNFTMKHKLFWGLETAKKSIKLLQAFPARIRSLEFFNMDYVVDSLLSVIRPLMPKKIQQRVVLHTNGLEALYDSIPMKMLPREYLPDDYEGACAGDVNQLISKLKEDLTQPLVRERIQLYTRSIYGIQHGKRPNESLSDSYRKLPV